MHWKWAVTVNSISIRIGPDRTIKIGISLLWAFFYICCVKWKTLQISTVTRSFFRRNISHRSAGHIPNIIMKNLQLLRIESIIIRWLQRNYSLSFIKNWSEKRKKIEPATINNKKHTHTLSHLHILRKTRNDPVDNSLYQFNHIDKIWINKIAANYLNKYIYIYIKEDNSQNL